MAVTPVALVVESRIIARFEATSFEFPWFTAPLKNITREHRDWLADTTRFHAEMDALEDQGLSDDEEQAIYDRLLTKLGLTNADLDLFSAGLSVHFSDGSAHRIGPVYYEDGDLRWRNGEELSGADAKVDDALNWTQTLLNFAKAIFIEFAIQIGAMLLVAGLFFAWLFGWFG